jgi:hypothetical protein
VDVKGSRPCRNPGTRHSSRAAAALFAYGLLLRHPVGGADHLVWSSDDPIFKGTDTVQPSRNTSNSPTAPLEVAHSVTPARTISA